LIGIRHRLSQTLYVSDTVQPHAYREPSYGKLHIGIYVAAVMDAFDRAKQRAAGSGNDSGDPSGGPSDGRGGPEDDKKQKDGGGNKKRKKGGSSKKEGGSTASDGTKHGMAAKVCPI